MEGEKSFSQVENVSKVNNSLKSVEEDIAFLQAAIIFVMVLMLIQTSLFFLRDQFPMKTSVTNNIISFLTFPIFFILYYWKIDKPLWVIFTLVVFYASLIIFSTTNFMFIKLLGFGVLIIILFKIKKKNILLKKGLNKIIEQNISNHKRG